jgi:ribonuclease G
MVEHVITEYKGLALMAEIVDGTVEDITVLDESCKYRTGDIVIAKISEINPNRTVAFVELGDVKGFLSLSEKDILKVGDELPVMVAKEAYGNKDMTVTKRLSIAGKYAVVDLPASNIPSLHISRKIKSDEIRTKLTDEIEAETEACGYDVTLRTKAGEAHTEDIKAEIRQLSSLLDDIQERAATRTVYSRLYEASDPFVTHIRDSKYLADETEANIVTDIPKICDKMKKCFPQASVRSYSDESMPLYVVYRIGSVIESVKDRTVWLKSGAYIVIDRTEAMCVIDVNTGKADMKLPKEEAFLAVNREAAKEIARQLRIRNISGIIMVDFINMKHRESYDALRKHLEEVLEYDLCGASFVDFTKLGVAEITRRKTYRPLKDILADKKI